MSTVDVGLSAGGGTESDAFVLNQPMEGINGDGSVILGSYQFDYSGINDHSQQTDTSTDTDDKNQVLNLERYYDLCSFVSLSCLISMLLEIK